MDKVTKTSYAAMAYELAGTCQEWKHIDEFKPRGYATTQVSNTMIHAYTVKNRKA
jgi:hypothetical protein